MTLLEKSQKLIELRNSIAEQETKLDKILEPLKEERDRLNLEILADLKETGQYSARFDFGTVTRAVRKTFRVVNESEVIAWLKKKKLAKEYTAVRLTDSFEALGKEAVKTGQIIPGGEIRETEYISINKSEKEDKRKITNEVFIPKSKE